MTARFTAWRLARKRRAMVAELDACYAARGLLIDRALALEVAIHKHDEDNAPDWSPLVEYRGGELLRLPDGGVYRVGRREPAGARKVDGEPVRVARSRREAFGHDATLADAERKAGAGPALAVAACYVLAVVLLGLVLALAQVGAPK